MVGQGSEKKAFNVHEKALRESSPYFATLLDSSFVETSTEEVVLDTNIDTVLAFNKIVEYMYSFHRDYSLKDGKSESGITVAKIFLMAGRLCMDHLQELTLQKMSKAMQSSYRARKLYWNMPNFCWIIDLIYSNTAAPKPGDANTDYQANKTTTTVDAGGNKAGTTSSEQMRKLVGKYAASIFGFYKDEAQFKEILRNHPDFADEVMAAMLPGPQVE